MTDAAGQLVEQATYCKPNDEKRPSLVGLPDFTTQQVCPADGSAVNDAVDGAYPDGWYIRIMFDELLDPEIETLTEVIDADTGEPTDTYVGSIAGTHPVNLRCESVSGGMIDVDYDGYYSPSGNRVTWPLGPSLVIKPNDPTLIATNSSCEVTINDNVVDKGGTPVEAAQRGPYKFKVAPIKVVLIDPPDDPEFDDPVTGRQIFFDNFYIQFNTFVDVTSLCPENGNDFLGLCDEEIVKFKSVTNTAMPTPGKCDTTLKGCNSMADCDAGAGDTFCGRGYCDYNGTICRDFADCAPPDDTNCAYNTVYSLAPFGLTDAEFGAGPAMPLESEAKYTFEIPAGTKLKDRCGRETTLGEPNEDDQTLVHFVTDKFELDAANIVTGETAQAVKKPQLNFTNVVEGGDATFQAVLQLGGIPAIPVPTLADSEWSLEPLPYLNATTQLTQSQVAIAAPDLSGQIQFRGHYKLATDYTFTLKAGATINDPYGKTWTNPEDLVIKWKTEPAVRVTSLGLRDIAQLISVTNNGTLVKSSPTTQSDIRIGFNNAMDATTIGLDDVTVDPMPPDLAVGTASGCGTTSTSCTLRIRGTYAPGTYKITLKKGAQFKDLFGTDYTQAEDQTITVTVEEAPATPACL